MHQRLIISPHLDDAWFDLGGSINEWRKAGDEVTVIDVFSVQAFTRGSVLPTAEATRIRKLEEQENARRDQVELKFLDLREALLRGYKAIFPPAIDWTIDRAPFDSMVAELRTGSESLGAGDAVYFPLGAGGHVDHLLVREAFTILGSDFANRGVEIEFYEDLPYACSQGLPLAFISQHRLEPVFERIEIEHKLKAVRAYKTQVDEQRVGQINDYAYALRGDGQAYERRWALRSKVQGPKSKVPVSQGALIKSNL